MKSVVATAFLLALTCVAHADGDKPSPGVPANVTPGDAPKATNASSPTAQQLETFRRRVFAELVDKKLAVRVDAAERLVAAWPESAPVLDAALACDSVEIRLIVVQLLGRKELGDTRDRIRKCFADEDAYVRTQAVRIARHLEWPKVEPDLMRLVALDPVWTVRQEALRGLEDLGTKSCLSIVLAGWRDERDVDRRRRYKRVLVKIVGSDYGEDVDAWSEAVIALAQRKDR